MVHQGREDVAQRDRQKIQAHHEGLELLGRLGVGELQDRNGGQDLAGRQEHVGKELPADVRRQALGDSVLDPRRHDKA